MHIGFPDSSTGRALCVRLLVTTCHMQPSGLTLIFSFFFLQLTLMFQNHVWVDVTRHNSNLPPLAVKNPECLGLLHKMDKNKEMWVQHYCILKDGCLFLYSGIRATHAYGMYTSCFIQDKSFFVCVFVFFVGVRYHKLDNNSKDILA